MILAVYSVMIMSRFFICSFTVEQLNSCGLFYQRFFSVQLGDSLDSIGNFWLSNKRNGILNMITAAAIWSFGNSEINYASRIFHG